MESKKEGRELRFVELLSFDKTFRKQGFKVIAGVDEAGRGPLAGPVVAAACILPANNKFIGIDDSKKLSAAQRLTLFEKLTSDSRVSYGIGIASSQEIDQLNIYHATLVAMKRAVTALQIEPEMLLVDGMPFSYGNLSSTKIIGGDAKSLSIAAASIIAKETRDRLMREFHEIWPDYGFDSHKGYSTPQHLSALKVHGPISIHRFSFAPVLENANVAKDLPIATSTSYSS
ncbi:MAG: ribonuclease HII [Parachlamydiaceae bacterium]|nr:ribonuclease HII [Parachlamydiaceae bacterium]